MPDEVQPVDLKKEVEKELIEKAKQREAVTKEINELLEKHKLRLVIEQTIRIVPTE